ncbi:MAG: phosphoribosylamine--glycine ligase [Peptococcaceae bacterium]|nr:phosphoribosylamine--glycine ligase [Peptococcaceae bacterium]
MKVLVIGGGGREHALVWKLSQSPRVKEILAAPGNPGMSDLATCVDINAGDVSGLVALARQEQVDLTFVGPEEPLVKGGVTAFETEGLKIVGPGRRAAALEGSKSFAKGIMHKHGVPTAAYRSFSNPSDAADYIRRIGGRCVVKADGLAAGKGVVVAEDETAALQAVEDIMVKKRFGGAGKTVVVEELLEGEEASVLAFTDGETVLPLLPAQDHKQVWDGDKGPNTGGMGAYAPAPVCTPEIYHTVVEKILKPTIRGLKEEGCTYKGILYAGLMITSEGPKVLEFNVRFGDPEAQPLLTLLDTDLVEIGEAIIEERLHEVDLKWKQGAAACVVLASQGYPGSYEKGKPIEGLDDIPEGVTVFHAGTAVKDGRLVTAGGRVLGVTARGHDLASAIDLAYEAVGRINFEGMHYRKDIGQKGLRRSKI